MAKVHDVCCNNYVYHSVSAVFKTRPHFVPDEWVVDEIDFGPEEAELDEWPEGACHVFGTFIYRFDGEENNWDVLKAGDALLNAVRDKDNEDLIFAVIENDVD